MTTQARAGHGRTTRHTTTTAGTGLRRARHGTVAAVVGLLLTAATACTTGGDSGDQDGQGPGGGTDRPTASSTPTTTDTDAGGKVRGFAKTWRPRLQNLAEQADISPCQRPSTTACAQAIEDIMAVSDDLSNALEDAGAFGDYPKTVAQITKLDLAQVEYNTAGCEGDPGADADGSPCFRHALAVTMGPTMLDLALATDEPGPIPES